MKAHTPTAVVRARRLATSVEELYAAHPDEADRELAILLVGLRNQIQSTETSLRRLPPSRQVTMATNKLHATRLRVDNTLLGQLQVRHPDRQPGQLK